MNKKSKNSQPAWSVFGFFYAYKYLYISDAERIYYIYFIFI